MNVGSRQKAFANKVALNRNAAALGGITLDVAPRMNVIMPKRANHEFFEGIIRLLWFHPHIDAAAAAAFRKGTSQAGTNGLPLPRFSSGEAYRDAAEGGGVPI